MVDDFKERSLHEHLYNGKYLVIDKNVCKFYHDHLEEYIHIYKPESYSTTDEIHAMCILEALITLLSEPLIDRQHDPLVNPVQYKLNL